ncbi:MAG: sugar transferase [Bacteroidales bacterium]|nr:sugar transferase [Bacteroidales bacterium]
MIKLIMIHNPISNGKKSKLIIQERKRDNNPLFSVIDIIITILSYFFAYFITNLIHTEYFVFTREYVIMLFLIIPTWAILLQTSNLTKIPRTRSNLDIFFNFLNFNSIGFALLFLYKHLFGLTAFSHYYIISFSVINLLSLYTFRIVTFRVFKYFRATGHNIHNVIVYADKNSEKFIEAILNHKEWGFRILMIITDSQEIKKKYTGNIRTLPDKFDLKRILDIDIIDEVIYCKSVFEEDKVRNLIDMCEEIGVTFRLQSDLSPMSATNAHLTNIENTLFVTFMNTPKNSLALAWKSFSEFWISFVILFLLSPLMLFIALIIKFTSQGPIIFKQERVGLRGRKFYIYKFRTMVQNAEELKKLLEKHNESSGPTFKIKNDPRITIIGRIIRKTGLDELPQLFNVLKGEMSLIGPRPPIPAEVEKYERWQLRRLSVKPGITCTWQIIPNRNEVLFDKWMKLDIQYIENWSLKKDLLLFFKTIKTIFWGTGY